MTKLCFFNLDNPPFLSFPSIVFTGSLFYGGCEKTGLLVMRWGYLQHDATPPCARGPCSLFGKCRSQADSAFTNVVTIMRAAHLATCPPGVCVLQNNLLSEEHSRLHPHSVAPLYASCSKNYNTRHALST